MPTIRSFPFAFAIAAAAAVSACAAGPGAQVNGVAVPAANAARLSPADFTRLHGAMAPKGERWEEIPWETDLGAARARAAREGKPLLMWVMDGHPLGCT